MAKPQSSLPGIPAGLEYLMHLDNIQVQQIPKHMIFINNTSITIMQSFITYIESDTKLFNKIYLAKSEFKDWSNIWSNFWSLNASVTLHLGDTRP